MCEDYQTWKKQVAHVWKSPQSEQEPVKSSQNDDSKTWVHLLIFLFLPLYTSYWTQYKVRWVTVEIQVNFLFCSYKGWSYPQTRNKIIGKLLIKIFSMWNFCGLSEAAKFCPLSQVLKFILYSFTSCPVSSTVTTYPQISDAQISVLVKFYSPRKSNLFNSGIISLFLSRCFYSNI